MNNSLVSVITPVYNCEQYIDECITSVAGQTYKNWEMIIIDDGSTDKTYNKVAVWAKKDKRIKIFRQKNRGSGPARNRGIAEAEGEYIAFLDGDDFWRDHCVLARIMTEAGKLSCDVMGSFYVSYKDGVFYKSELHHEYFAMNETIKQIDFRDEQNCFNYGSYLFRKSFLEVNNITFPEYLRFQDPPFLANVLVRAQKYYVIPLEWYCVRVGYKRELSTQQKNVDFLKGVIDVMKIAQSHHLEKMLNDMTEQINEFSQSIIHSILKGNTELLSLLYKADKFIDEKRELEPLKFIRSSTQIRCDMITNTFWNKVNQVARVIIYGAGKYGTMLQHQIEKKNTDVEIVFAETDLSLEREINGKKCYQIDSLTDYNETSLVVIAVAPKTQQPLLSNMMELGFKNYMCLDRDLIIALECTG